MAITIAALTPEDNAAIDGAGKRGEGWWQACVKAGKVLPYDERAEGPTSS